MNRDQFLRDLRRYCKKAGLDLVIDTRRGKGSHYTVRIGDRFTTLPSGELKTGLKEGVLKTLGLPKDAV